MPLRIRIKWSFNIFTVGIEAWKRRDRDEVEEEKK